MSLRALKSSGNSLGKKLHGEGDHLRWVLKDEPWRWTRRGTDLTNKYWREGPRQREYCKERLRVRNE